MFHCIVFLIIALVLWRDRQFWKMTGVIVALTLVIFVIVQATGVNQ